MTQVTQILSQFFDLPEEEIDSALTKDTFESENPVLKAVSQCKTGLLNTGELDEETVERLISKGKPDWQANQADPKYGTEWKVRELLKLGLERASWVLPTLSERWHEDNRLDRRFKYQGNYNLLTAHEFKFWKKLSVDQLKTFAQRPDSNTISRRLFETTGSEYQLPKGQEPIRKFNPDVPELAWDTWYKLRDPAEAVLRTSTPDEMNRNLDKTKHQPRSPWNFIKGSEGPSGNRHWRWSFHAKDDWESFRWDLSKAGEREKDLRSLERQFKTTREKAELALAAIHKS
ncbi:MAG: hypothetical protein AAB383_06720 [Patescibacteria group bacterium]